MAGGMIRELRDLWETQLVPLLKEELSEEMSTEQRIVNASLRCIEETQRAGVEALFVCFGCFAEDEVVPAANHTSIYSSRKKECQQMRRDRHWRER